MSPLARSLAAGWAAVAVLFSAPRGAHAQDARLELRLVPQSGIPGTLCVFDDPPTPPGSADPPIEAWVSPGIAKRLEVQFRLIDPSPADGPAPLALRSASIGIALAQPSTGLWSRALLSVLEGEPGADPTPTQPIRQVDCSGLPTAPTLRKRGLHQPFRDALGGPDPSEDADNGTIQPRGVFAIRPLATAPPAHAAGAWIGLYTLDFTPPADAASAMLLTAFATGEFQWYDAQGAIHTSTLSAPANLTLRLPAGPTACCSHNLCAIALSPSACFAAGGFVATGNACATSPDPACCFGDFNRDGAVSVQDVLDFVTAYLGGSRLADVNGSGTLTVQDVFDFLSAYFGGCA